MHDLYRGVSICAVTALALGGKLAADASPGLLPRAVCERTHVLKISFEDRGAPATVTVHATGPSCRRAKVVASVADSAGRLLWSEETALSLIESGDVAADGDPEIQPERVADVVDHWVTIEPIKAAPPWPAGGASPVSPTAAADQTQYESRLDRPRYERVRARGGQMLCVPTGPETAHCLVFDPAINKLIEFFVRGV